MHEKCTSHFQSDKIWTSVNEDYSLGSENIRRWQKGKKKQRVSQQEHSLGLENNKRLQKLPLCNFSYTPTSNFFLGGLQSNNKDENQQLIQKLNVLLIFFPFKIQEVSCWKLIKELTYCNEDSNARILPSFPATQRFISTFKESAILCKLW